MTRVSHSAIILAALVGAVLGQVDVSAVKSDDGKNLGSVVARLGSCWIPGWCDQEADIFANRESKPDALKAPWTLHFDRDGTEDVALICDADGEDLATSCHFWRPEGDEEVPPTLAALRAMKAVPKLLAYAGCEAAIACGKADPRYDPKPVLTSHGWNEQTESAGLFLARIRRKAVGEATGSCLGRAA